MQGLMQDYPLTTQHILWRMERLYGPKEIVTKTDAGLRRVTYRELTGRIHRLAHALTKLGVKKGDRVATLCWNNDRHLELYYAIPCLGAVLHTLNLRLFPAQLEFTVKDAEDTLIFADSSLISVLNQVAGKIPSVRQMVVIKDEGQELPEHQLGELLDYETLLQQGPDQFDWPRLDERAAAAMCYTSGTTGNPKGVVYSHRSQFLHAMAGLQADTLALSEQDALLPVVPMFHANSWGLPYAVGLAGAKMIFPDRFAGDPQALIDLADSEGATLLAGVPTIWINFLTQLRKDGRRLDKVRLVLCGGSAVPRGLMEGMDAAGLRMIHAWGMTETSPIGSMGVARSWLPREQELEIRLRQGVPVPGVEIRIADLATGLELPWDGQAFGEIQCRGPWIASGYHNNADPTRLTEDGWFRTGDVATIDQDGYISIVDRTKDVIKSGGEWISSVELEGAIMAHPKVLEACVIGIDHPKWQERPVAYVVARPEAKGELTEAEIREFLAGKVANWWLPDEIRFIDEVPKTSTFKFDKKALRADAEPLHESQAAGAPPA
ncbi:MAG: long-chain fatty acid--CoA ligase [Candidatus Dormibacter sp.]|uniref:long-chain fatty acid--CoA ligase n=1 Tax=Candidatus Dormibacter sp. TaxID=2973982 RepID=UPI000DB28AEE|nr:MAG: long-chain fatty acid--CoA ligase [Candidatus Dormibacteraeota bacterium]